MEDEEHPVDKRFSEITPIPDASRSAITVDFQD